MSADSAFIIEVSGSRRHLSIPTRRGLTTKRSGDSQTPAYSDTMTLESARFTTTSAGAPPVKTIDPSPAVCWSTGPGS